MIGFKKFINEEKEKKKYHKFFSSSKAKHPDDEKEENKKYHKFFSSSKAKHPDDINEEEEKGFEHHPDALVHSKILSEHKDLHNAIQNYTGPFHAKLNRNLFIGKEHEKVIQETDDNVSKALRKTKALRDHVVYSGMRSPENLETNPLTGMIHMQHPAYLSASHNFEKALRYEDEYLIHKNAQIHIHPKPTIDHEKGVVIWHGKLVHDGIEKTSYHPDNTTN